MSINWDDEDYYKLYLRDTAAWRMLSWQARGLCLEITRKVDKSGILHVGKLGLRGVATLVGGTFEAMEPFLCELIDAGKFVFREDLGELLLVDHVRMQGARQSDAQRKRKSRQAKRDAVLDRSQNVTSRDSVTDVTDTVTRGHKMSRIEEKRGEEIKNTPLPPAGGSGLGAAPDIPETGGHIPESGRAPPPLPPPLRPLTDDGAFGMTPGAWQEGVRAATSSPVAALSLRQTRDLQALTEAHADGRQGERLMAWVRKLAEHYARYELADAEGRYGFTPARCSAWLTAGSPEPRTRSPDRRSA